MKFSQGFRCIFDANEECMQAANFLKCIRQKWYRKRALMSLECLWIVLNLGRFEVTCGPDCQAIVGAIAGWKRVAEFVSSDSIIKNIIEQILMMCKIDFLVSFSQLKRFQGLNHCVSLLPANFIYFPTIFTYSTVDWVAPLSIHIAPVKSVGAVVKGAQIAESQYSCAKVIRQRCPNPYEHVAFIHDVDQIGGKKSHPSTTLLWQFEEHGVAKGHSCHKVHTFHLVRMR